MNEIHAQSELPASPGKANQETTRSQTGILAPAIPDQELIRFIGSGSYGEVWLSRSATEKHRAVKIVYRARFNSRDPFDREFVGLKNFERVCHSHPGLVALLQVGINRKEDYFYYVMEAADDLEAGVEFEPAKYQPKTLRALLNRYRRLSPTQCFIIGKQLADALCHLQQHGLIHRDVKPSNIIFVHDHPKFADIGLVTSMDEPASCVGTDHYMPPEGPGGPTSDLYALGRVLYEMSTGLSQDRFPELPTELLDGPQAPLLKKLNRIILKACAHEASRRYQSAREMHADLASSGQKGPEPAVPDTPVTVDNPPPAVVLQVAVVFKSKAQPDAQLLEFLRGRLPQHGFHLFIDEDQTIGVEWVRRMENAIRSSDAVVVLLSESSVSSEMVAYDVEQAARAAEKRHGIPRLLPIFVQYAGALPDPLNTILSHRPHLQWQGPEENEQLLTELVRILRAPVEPEPAPGKIQPSAPIGGAVALDSDFYVERSTDSEFKEAISRKDSIVLVKGARQIGKTSLLARGLNHARKMKSRVVLTDFQKLDANHLASVESLFLKFGDFLADQLDLTVFLGEVWDQRRSPNTNFERYLRHEVLSKVEGHLVWGLDEVDRLFGRSFASEVFGLLRSWHNERALDPDGPWSRLTLVIAYATEAHLFIDDINQSPFNVGTRLSLEDFNLEQVSVLNQRYGRPLPTDQELGTLYDLLGGQPYLVQQALNQLASNKIQFSEFVEKADGDEGIFGDHLRRILVLLAKDAKLYEMVQSILQGRICREPTSFYRLRSAGVMKGDSPEQVRPRCRIYETFLKRHLLQEQSSG